MVPMGQEDTTEVQGSPPPTPRPRRGCSTTAPRVLTGGRPGPTAVNTHGVGEVTMGDGPVDVAVPPRLSMTRDPAPPRCVGEFRLSVPVFTG